MPNSDTFFAYYPTALGTLEIGWIPHAVTQIRFTDAPPPDSFVSMLSDCAAEELCAYLAGERRSFTFPVLDAGTPFQRACRTAALAIPYGETRSYGQIAAQIGRPRAARAVGSAMAHNPLWIVIPCHRVVGANGALTGYAGGIERKAALLRLEQQQIACKTPENMIY